MPIARSCSSLLLVAFCRFAEAQTVVAVPSSPKSWPVEQVAHPKGTAECAGGDVSALLALVPGLEPQTLAQYEGVTHTSFGLLRGIRPTDWLYPFNFGTTRANGGRFDAAGFYVVRGRCIIHVHRLEFIN